MWSDHFFAEENIKLNVTPSALKMSGEWVEVGWSGVNQPTDQDWVGVWVLPYISSNINAQTQAPVKYQVSRKQLYSTCKQGCTCPQA